MDALFLSVAAFIATLAGGAFALRLRDRLRFLLGLTAGVLLGVVGFELLPEIFKLARQSGNDGSTAMIAMVGGFLAFHTLEKTLLMRRPPASDGTPIGRQQIGLFTTSALIGHSVMDGVAIGLAFQVSHSVGIAVAVAIITHDFSDGANTVALMLSHRHTALRASVMLFLDALAPILGVALTWTFTIAAPMLVLYLGLFAGFLWYIAASELLPQAHLRATPRTSVRVLALTGFGAAFALAVARVAA